MKLKLLLLSFLLTATLGWGQAFNGNYSFASVTTASGTTDPTAVPVATGLTFGSFVSGGASANSSAGSRFSFTGFDTGATNGSDTFSGSINTGKYYEVTITPQVGYSLDINSITFTLQRSGTGIRQYAVRSSLDYSLNLPANISPVNAGLSVVGTNVFQVSDGTTSAATGSTITLGASYDVITTPITFRFYGWNAETSGGTFSIDDVVFNGVATSSCSPPTITSHPSDQTICTSSSTSFTVATSAGSPAYQWEMSANGSNGWVNVVNGIPAGVTYINSTSSSLGVVAASAITQYYYRAKVTSGGCSAWSNNGKLVANSPALISGQPTNQTVAAPATATFNVAASGTGVIYQWEVSTNAGSSWSAVGINSSSYTTPATTVGMSGYLYRCVLSTGAPCSNTVTSGTATLTVNTAPCLDENFNSFTGVSFGGWTATGMTNYTSGSNSGIAPNAAQFNDSGDVLLSPAFSYATELSFMIKGNSTNSASALLVEGYNGTSWITIDNITNALPTLKTTKIYNASSTPVLPVNLTRFRFTYTKSSGNLAFDDVKVYCGTLVTSCTTPVTQPTALGFSGTTTTSANGAYSTAGAPGASGYLVVYSLNNALSASDLPVNGAAYSIGAAIGDGTVGYVGSGTSFSLSGLASSTTYYTFVFAYNSGTCAIAYNTASPLSGSFTTVAAYCASSGNTEWLTSVTNVSFNSINNNSTKTTGYSDYTTISTNVEQGNSYSLSARINTDGNYVVLGYAWIDFNHDLDFNDAGEAFDLGLVSNNSNGLTTLSPLSIAIPLNAAVGATRMRVIATYDGDSTPCLSGFDGEVEDYTINIIPACIPTHSLTDFVPNSGPTGTDVTITGTGFTAGTTVLFNGIATTVVFVNSTTLVATVPAGSAGGVVTVTEAGCKVMSAANFTQIVKTGTCTSGTNLTDLIISEVYDSEIGNSWYMELYNPTGNAIDLNAGGANYTLLRYGDIGGTAGIRTVDISGVIPAGGVYLADLGSDSSCGALGFNYASKSNGINENDEVRLTKNGVTVDIVYCMNEKGYSIRRKVTSSGPSAVFNFADWDLLSAESCANLGTVPFVTANSTPNITTSPSDFTACNNIATFTANASAAGSGTLTYQWYYNTGINDGWTALVPGSFAGIVAAGVTTNTLSLTGTIISINGYQFYCQVTQDGTCAVASDAAQLKMNSTTWNGTAWSNGTPDLTKLTIINGNYNTTINGNINACSLIVNVGFTATLTANQYINIQNDLTVNGTLDVLNQGSLVMISNSGIVTNNGTTTVRKMSTMFDKYDYTFWSSPVVNTPISVFSQWQSNYIFKLNTAAFRDDNNDSHDDSMDAWVFTPQTEIMSPGRGYAAMGKVDQTFPAQQGSVYSGVVNNGIITQPIALSLDNAKANDDFNLIGNPYPSAISADAFITANPSISGTLYFWTHEGNIQVAAINPGPMAMNFSPDDFAYYNLTGGTGTRAGLLSGNGNSNAPSGFIASGQGFQIDAEAATSVTFNNNMRNKTHINTDFYRNVNVGTASQKDRVWLNLTNPEGIFSQQLIGYFSEATMGVDTGYDGYYTKSPTYAAFYSIIDDAPFKIQGRSTFDVNDSVPLGFRSAYEKTYSISIGDIEGVLRNQNVYIEDLQLNMIHDLKISPYIFSTPAGEFNNRFVLRFTNYSSNNDDFETMENSVVVFTNDGINVSSSVIKIKDVLVYDVLGRLITERKNLNSNLTELSNVRATQSALIVKVTLQNGRVVTKKVIY